jgi:hypothetical protein
MEKNGFLLPVATGAIGILIGAIGMFFVFRSTPELFSISKPCPPTLTEQQVSTYMSNFQSVARPYQDTLKGFTIDLQQFDAMNCLLVKNSQLAGFRVYFGIDAAGANTTMVVGMDNTGNDVRTMFYNVSQRFSGPCPPICDANTY